MNLSGTKILLYSHQANLAGAPICLVDLLNELPATFEAFWVCPERGPVTERIRNATKFVLGKLFLKYRLKKLMIREKISLMHANTLFAWPAVQAAHSLRIPVVWHIHEDLNQFPKIWRKKILKYSTEIVVVAEWMKKFFPKSSKVHVIENGIQEPKQLKVRNSIQTLFTCVGTIEPRKGMHTLIEAARILHEKRLTFKVEIYGQPLKTTQDYFRNLKNKIQTYGLQEKVFFRGVREDIIKVMATSTAVIVPSLSEPFGRVAVEAMAAHKPVIAAQVGGLAEIVIDRKTGFLFQKENASQLAELMEVLIQNRSGAIRMGKSGFLRFKKQYRLKMHVQKMIRLYRKLLN